MRYDFQRIAQTGYRSGVCDVCGKRGERQVTIEQTVNPFNKNPDGTVKTVAQVVDAVNAELRAWKAKPFVHARCEADQ